MEGLTFYSWFPEAACVGEDPEMFFDEAGQVDSAPTKAVAHHRALAKKVCFECPVRLNCLKTFINERWGVYGGLDQRERANLRRNLARKRDRAAST